MSDLGWHGRLPKSDESPPSYGSEMKLSRFAASAKFLSRFVICLFYEINVILLCIINNLRANTQNLRLITMQYVIVALGTQMKSYAL